MVTAQKGGRLSNEIIKMRVGLNCFRVIYDGLGWFLRGGGTIGFWGLLGVGILFDLGNVATLVG